MFTLGFSVTSSRSLTSDITASSLSMLKPETSITRRNHIDKHVQPQVLICNLLLAHIHDIEHFVENPEYWQIMRDIVKIKHIAHNKLTLKYTIQLTPDEFDTRVKGFIRSGQISLKVQYRSASGPTKRGLVSSKIFF